MSPRASHGPAAGLLALLALLSAGLPACGAPPVPGAEGLATALLLGEERLCLSDADCASTVCSFGVCAGLVAADRPWMTEAIVAAIGRHLAGGELPGAVLRARFADELAAGKLPALKRARLLRGWAAVDAPAAADRARPLFADADNPPILRFEAARLLLRDGDPAAGEWLLQLVRLKGPGVVPFLVAEWRFFAPSAKAAILDLVTARGDAALRSRLLTLDQQGP